MSYHVFGLVSFCYNLNKEKKLIEIAKKFYDPKNSDDSTYFLKSIITKKTLFGVERGTCIWGGVSNYFRGESFIEKLENFFGELYKNKVLGPYSRIVIMWESEQSVDYEGSRIHAPHFIELRHDKDSKSLTNSKGELPFNWGML